MRVYFLGAIYLTCVWWGKAQVLPFFEKWTMYHKCQFCIINVRNTLFWVVIIPRINIKKMMKCTLKYIFLKLDETVNTHYPNPKWTAMLSLPPVSSQGIEEEEFPSKGGWFLKSASERWAARQNEENLQRHWVQMFVVWIIYCS